MLVVVLEGLLGILGAVRGLQALRCEGLSGSVKVSGCFRVLGFGV